MMWLPFTGIDHPLRLLLLIIIPAIIAGYIIAITRRNRHGMRFTNTSMLAQVLPRQSQWVRHVAVVAALLSLGLFITAFAKPTGTVMEPRERATIVLVLDSSRSMAATDVKPNRLAAAKTAAKNFVDSLPQQYPVSVVDLWGRPNLLVRATVDHTAVDRAIDGIQLKDSTAIGDSIAQALRAIAQAPPDPDHPSQPAPGAIVLLSDGGNDAGQAPAQEAAAAKAKKIPIYTIAFGTDTGYVDLDGKRYPVSVDKTLMRNIAGATGGQYFEAASAHDLQVVYQRIHGEVGYIPEQRSVAGRTAGIGLAFAGLAVLAAIAMAARWP